MNELEKYYGKFNEEKRLLRRHGQVEYITTMKYIHDYLKKGDHILDVGAGTGRYACALANEGYEVDAIEFVKFNLGTLKAKKTSVKAYQGTATDLSRYQDNTFDLTLIFGPMYHLFTTEEKLQALNEAKRVTKKDGHILVAYILNDYSIIIHGFRDGYIKEAINEGLVDENFKTHSTMKQLYDYMTLEDIDHLVKLSSLTRKKIIAADGAADYLRPVLKQMDDETFDLFIKYHILNCERKELLGASAHVVDILKNTK